MITLNDFPSDARPYLKEIADRLWSKHAAVMIGSGFSRNAVKNDHTKHDFPTWSGLGDLLYEKLHGRRPGASETYLNILKLADEVQAAFGRPALDKLVLDSLPDLDHSPSDLHINLLNLPWNDIFTTNYDTLLERASQNVYAYKYDLVVDKNELIFAEQPRIVKLHGSMPSERPFIVSEEDYRKYPRDFAPFVNTVQQSLLENTFCLLGFSSDDPNFLNWISWINDNLGVNNAPKIYLVGSSSLTDAQRRLLQSRNIIVVKLNEEGSQLSHQETLQIFFNYLTHYRDNERPLNWPDKAIHYTSRDLPQKVQDIIQHWGALRRNYPNWLIAPLQQRKDLWAFTGNFRLSDLDLLSIKSPDDLQLIYEYNWRMERCLCPIQDSDLPNYEAVLQKYESQVTNNILNRRGGEVEDQWLAVCLNVWRYYREESNTDQWQACAATLENFLPFLEGERAANIWYEKCLFFLYSLDYDLVKKCLSEWPANSGLPYWEAKRAMLLAETGQPSDAAPILENALFNVRKRTPSVDNLTDFTWVSQEAYLMQLLRYVTRSVSFARGNLRMEADSKDFVDRQNKLKLFNCDPWQELETFELMLEHPARDFEQPERLQMFRLGKTTTVHRLGGTNKDLLAAYQFVRYLEDTGIPPKLGATTYGDKALKEAILRIGQSSRSWAFGLIMRSGQEKSAKELLTRNFVAELPRTECNRLIRYFLDLGHKIIAQPTDNNETQKKRYAIPLILSRLIVKSSYENKLFIAEFLLAIYRSDARWHHGAIPELWRQLFDATSKREQFGMIELLLRFPVTAATNDGHPEYPEPFSFLKLRKKPASESRYCPAKELIDELLKLSLLDDGRRTNAFHRLINLYSVDLLNSRQISALAKSLWAITNENGLPAKTEYLFFSFINIPSPVGSNPVGLFKRYILAYEPNLQSRENKQGIGFTQGENQTLSDLFNGSKRLHFDKGITWTEDEAYQIFCKLVIWWDGDKKYLLEKETPSAIGNVPQEFRSRFHHLRRILGEVLALNSFWEKKVEIGETVKRLVKEMACHGLPINNLKLSFLKLFPEYAKEVVQEIENSLAINDPGIATDAYNMIIDLTVRQDIRHELEGRFEALVSLVVHQIKWRNYPILVNALHTIGMMLSNCPDELTPNHHEDLLFGLGHLLTETRKKEKFTVDELLVFRKRATRLAGRLFQFYNSSNLELPAALVNWKEAMVRKEEFDEIIIEWEGEQTL
ncbi:SIR2 family protein [Mucilaginibacter sabulilitoris]|uniref:SIR2 family protein n=1 Tax=Mucilaginibacter sabulilitoris TaxID=1173583 RepID=A0ABZ0TPF2_9SPHI|nr:SIR2 family protein [Mucilaginibacter sabulilitoris]WPU94671.1 SIR2 family protein [Mucilaginibacter sabulilitoris]